MTSNIVPIAPDRPSSAHNRDGYVYVIEFSGGTVKVGRTNNLHRRVAAHQSHGIKLGINVVRWWGSPIHRGFDQTERLLIKKAHAIGSIQGGKEYFKCASFDALVKFCAGLPMHPSTDEEVDRDALQDEASRNAVRDFFASMESTRHTVSVNSPLTAFVLALFFDERTPLPDLTGDLPAALREQLVEAAHKSSVTIGSDPSEIYAWTASDWMFHLLDTTVQTAKLKMQIRISDEDRDDLLDPWFEEAL